MNSTQGNSVDSFALNVYICWSCLFLLAHSSSLSLILPSPPLPPFSPSDIYTQHINGLAKTIPLDSTLQMAEVLCRQLGACQDLPDDLKCLVVRPSPKRFTSVVKMETIVCNPEGSAVPSGDCTVPSADCPGSSDTSTIPSVADSPVHNTDYPSAARPVPSYNSANQSIMQGIPAEDSLQSTHSTSSCDDLVV